MDNVTIRTFQSMIGKIFDKVSGKIGGEDLIFHCHDGREFCFFHKQDCCEIVEIEDIVGDLSDLVGSPITQAEEVSNELDSLEIKSRAKKVIAQYNKDGVDSQRQTWTFYKFSTNKGSVTVRFFGFSNGYYSEKVTFEEHAPKKARNWKYYQNNR